MKYRGEKNYKAGCQPGAGSKIGIGGRDTSVTAPPAEFLGLDLGKNSFCGLYRGLNSISYLAEKHFVPLTQFFSGGWVVVGGAGVPPSNPSEQVLVRRPGSGRNSGTLRFGVHFPVMGCGKQSKKSIRSTSTPNSSCLVSKRRGKFGLSEPCQFTDQGCWDPLQKIQPTKLSDAD